MLRTQNGKLCMTMLLPVTVVIIVIMVVMEVDVTLAKIDARRFCALPLRMGYALHCFCGYRKSCTNCTPGRRHYIGDPRGAGFPPSSVWRIFFVLFPLQPLLSEVVLPRKQSIHILLLGRLPSLWLLQPG